MIVNVICLIIFCRHLCFGGNESHLVVCPIVFLFSVQPNYLRFT